MLTTNIQTRTDLLDALATAAELEHLLLCQYLFAAYTVKRTAAEGLDDVQLSKARQWGSAVTLVARQEMEHLGLVMNMRSAIGGEAVFKRPNFPQTLKRFGSADLKQELTQLNADTIMRFRFFEQPEPAPAADYCAQPPEAAQANLAARLAELGIERKNGTFLPTEELLAHANARLRSGTLGAISFTSIQDLYLQIFLGFCIVAGKVGEKVLFSGDPALQIFGGKGSTYENENTMNDLNQYGVDIIQVSGIESMSYAVWEILLQGEGLFAPKSYIEHTHYCLFSAILAEMQADPELVVCRPVVANPLTEMHPDITAPNEVNLIKRQETLEVAQLTNYLYELMLYMLLVLYDGKNLTINQRLELMDAAFFPMMTMFVRPMSEILTQLPAFDVEPGNAGPGFELSGDLQLGDAKDDPLPAVQERIDAALVSFQKLSIMKMGKQYPDIVARLGYIAENFGRLADDFRAGFTNVGRIADAAVPS